MDNPQYYQPLSAALHAPLVAPTGRSPQPQYSNYSSHAHNAAPTSNSHREEEEEEEEDDEEVVEEELDNNNHHRHSTSAHSSPRTSAAQTGAAAGASTSHIHAAQNAQLADDSAEKRKPGRPRGSRNRKPRAPPNTSTKAPANSQHPGFYQYPPAPANTVSQNQQFYEFQWRALNLCSEFYNAAEELIKSASPIVIAQCYQMGPATKIDPLALISDAKRICDSLLANPSQLVGNPPPVTMYPPVPSYPQMPPPPAPGTSNPPGAASPAPTTVITNPQSFVMSLGNPAMPAVPHAQPYYPPPMYATPGSRYPTTPYYPYAQGAGQYYPPPTQSAPPTTTSISAPVTAAPSTPSSSTAGTLSTFSAATGNVAPGGQQGSWSEEETEKLRRLAEQSREMGGAQSKGEIEWDWVVHQWGNSRTRHQILLKATSMGLKESTTRGTKRRRGDTDGNTSANADSSNAGSTINAPQSNHAPPAQAAAHQPPPTQPSPIPAPARTPVATNTAAPSASPAMQSRPIPTSTSTTMAPSHTTNPPSNTTSTTPSTSNMPWPMPITAVNTSSPVLTHSTIDTNQQRSSNDANTNATNYYRSRPTSSSYSTTGATTASTGRPTSSHGSPTHQYMYRPNGAGGRRENGV